MLQELAALTRATAWVVGSMLFFLAAWVAVVVWIVRKRPEDLERQARLPLEDGTEGVRSQESGVRSQDDETAPTPES